jgi:hypothetical protein
VVENRDEGNAPVERRRRRRGRWRSRGRFLYRGSLRTRVLRGRRGFWFIGFSGSSESQPSVKVCRRCQVGPTFTRETTRFRNFSPGPRYRETYAHAWNGDGRKVEP